MKAASKRLVSLLASLGLLALSILVYALLLSPAYDEVNKLRGDLAARHDLVTEQKKIAEQVRSLLADYQSVAGLSDSISRSLPTKEDYPTLVNQIRGLADLSQMTLTDVSLATLPGAPRQGSNFPPAQTIQATINLTGSYAGLKSFLGSLERNIRIMDLINLSLTPSSGPGQNFSYNLVVNTYYQSL